MPDTDPATDWIKYLLDTNILLAYVRWQGLAQYIEATFQLGARQPTPVISIVTEAEIRVLAAQNQWGAFKRRMLEEKMLDFLTIVPIPCKGILAAYVEIDDYSRRRGRVMGKNDVWIAATAKVEQATILTTDRDYDHLHPHLVMREYIDPNSYL